MKNAIAMTLLQAQKHLIHERLLWSRTCRTYFDNGNFKDLLSIQIFSQVLVQIFEYHSKTIFSVNYIIKSTNHSTREQRTGQCWGGEVPWARRFHESPCSEYPPHANWAGFSSTLLFHLPVTKGKQNANRWRYLSPGIQLRKYLKDTRCKQAPTLADLIQLLVTLHIRLKTQRLFL